VTGFAANHVSGSTDVASEFLGELERSIATDVSTTPPQFRASLLRRLRAAQAAQPSMALIHQLAARALDVADTALRPGPRSRNRHGR